MADPRETPEEGGIVGPVGSTSPPQRDFPPPSPPEPAREPPQTPVEASNLPPPAPHPAPGEPFQGPPDDVELAPAPEVTDSSKFHYAGTDKNIDDPADANDADIELALSEGPWEAAPQPFRKRDGFPDLTQESVNIRLDRDYWPADTGRFHNQDQPRARAGDLKAFPSDEAIALIESGIGHREDTEGEEAAEGQRRAWKERDEDAERARQEARRRREDDGA